ncbi:MAG TPA: hypothetical protein VHW65_09095 [Gemmatimonadales bacterium]|nr:hypothetical protein [Gemmatimonadales bacterium]
MDQFRSAGATTAERARSLDALNVHDGFVLGRLQRRAVIREGANNGYYLDELSWAAIRHLRRRLLSVVLVLAIVLALAAATISWIKF